MLIEKDLQQALRNLFEHNGTPVKVGYDGSEILIRFVDNASKVFLTAPVYLGGNYIPASVRRCLSHKFPSTYLPSIRTYLSVDEQNFQINLHYLGQAESLNYGQLKGLIEEFAWISDRWRDYLDEHDKHDLVHVRVK